MTPWEQSHSEELLKLAVDHERDNTATGVCHNDLLPANVLELAGGGLRLIDFEYAGRGHQVVDWATIAVFGDIEGARRAEFLDVMSRDNVLRANAFPDAIRLVRLLAYFWARMVLRSCAEDQRLVDLRDRMQAALD